MIHAIFYVSYERKKLEKRCDVLNLNKKL